jgi:pSer/pThr/pTyr-binding forkhead associated (FHA) protein
VASVPPRAAATKKKKGPRGPRTLVVTAGPLAGTKITLGDQPILIGRADDSTLVLTDDFASSRHARLTNRGGQWYVEDLGSTNGTYLDQQRVQGPLLVNPGQPIRIGQTALELRT